MTRTQLSPFSIFKATSAQSVITNSCTLVQMEGQYSGTGSPVEYLQVFDKATAASANDVPVIVIPLTTTGPLPSFEEIRGCLPLYNGLSIGISTAEEKYTASGSQYTITGAVEEEDPLVIQGLTVATQAGVDTFPFFSSGVTTQLLYEVTVFNGESLDAYCQVWTNGDYALQPVSINGINFRRRSLAEIFVPDGTTGKMRFGKHGLTLLQSGMDSTTATGLYMTMSRTAGIYTLTGGSNSTFTVKYKST